MIRQYVTCDFCCENCETGIWYQIYQAEGSYKTGKITNVKQVCDKCFNKMLSALKGGEEK